jgi:hypothetical protein
MSDPYTLASSAVGHARDNMVEQRFQSTTIIQDLESLDLQNCAIEQAILVDSCCCKQLSAPDLKTGWL